MSDRPSRRPAVIFLDDGGVMNDNAVRAVEWRRLIGEYLAPRLGGTPEAWGDANTVVFERQWARFEAWNAQPHDDGAYGDFFTQREERTRWLRETCEHAGIDPPDDDECYRLACDTDAYVVPRVRAFVPGAVDTIRALSAGGFALATASGHTSSDLETSLTREGVRDLFVERLYGSDLVRSLKNGSEFYRRVFDDAGVHPRDALVVDDSPRAVAWATQLGAQAVLVTNDARNQRDDLLTIGSLAELPALLDA